MVHDATFCVYCFVNYLARSAVLHCFTVLWPTEESDLIVLCSEAVYRLACHRLLPWLRVTFAMVPDAAWPGSEQRPRGTASATGLLGWLGRPSATNPWGVVCCFPSLVCPRCTGVCGVLGPLALVHRCPCPACSCVRCPWPLGACSSLCAPGVFCVRCP